MEDTSQTLKRHLPALAIALLFGLSLAGIFLVIRADPSFAGVYPGIENDQEFYLSRIQDVRDGYPMSGNSYLAEGKAGLPMQFLTGEIVEARILDILGLPTKDALWFFPLVLGPMIFLLTYALFRAVRAPRPWAVLGATTLCFGIFFFAFGRPISPQFNFPFWLAAAWGFIKLIEKPRWRTVIVEAMLVGALFYLYPYYWTHLLAALGIGFFVFLLIDRKTAWRICAAGAGSIPLGMGYLALAAKARTLPEATESFARLGFVHTYFPSGAVLVMFAAAAFAAAAAIVWAKRKEAAHDRAVLAPAILLLAGIAAMNQHIVTGMNMEFSSHYAMQIVFASFALAVAAVSRQSAWPALSRPVARVAFVFAIALIVASGTLPAYQTAQAAMSADPDLAARAAIISWLDTQPSGVVLAPEGVAVLVPAYTASDAFYARNANIAFIASREVFDRFIIQNYRAEFNEAFIVAHERELFGHGYLNAYGHAAQARKFLKFVGVDTPLPERTPRAAMDAVQERARELQSLPFMEAIAPYRANYFVIDTASPNDPTAADLDKASLVFKTGSFEVFSRSSMLP